MSLDRRSFLRVSLAGGAGAAAFGTEFWRATFAHAAVKGQVTVGDGPYGSLAGRSPDENGMVLPAGFRSEVVATANAKVAGTDYVWHTYPDGGVTFEADGGWIYVSNSEIDPGGGVGAIRFDGDGGIVDAYPILQGTRRNCSGGPTPWGTWLSCEEEPGGQVWECDPTGKQQAVARSAMGSFQHEAVAVDPSNRQLYLTEDEPDGRLYRFTPSKWPSLAEGVLEAAYVAVGGRVSWVPVPDPSASGTATRHQTPVATAFNGGEGCWYDTGSIYFTTKGDNRVNRYDIFDGRHAVIYDGNASDGPLKGVDNVTAAPSGDLYICEDGGDMQLVLVTPRGEMAPFLQLPKETQSELCGAAFSPDGRHLYVSSMRSGPGEKGVTYAVSGPFRGTAGRQRTDDALGGTAGRAAGVLATAGIAGGLILAARRRGTQADDGGDTDSVQHPSSA